jgi:ATP-dependent exoDNAse (exonuclease V) beta subunit
MTINELQTLHVDKENDQVNYNDELHKYWVKESNQFCISVTTLIHQFTNFDEDFWSSYKTLEKLTGDNFARIKPILLKTKNFKLEYLNQFHISVETFTEAKNSLLKEWALARETSCIRGTQIHKEHELEHLAGHTQELKELGFSANNNFKVKTSNKLEIGVQGVYPELLLSYIDPDKKLRLAGQADLVIVDGFDVFILDYKTNKKIDMKSFYDSKTKSSTMLKYPLNTIPDSNFWHYTLQLSLYAWMIQQIDSRFNIKLLQLIHYDHDGQKTLYECKYLKNDVIRMLAYYKKQIDYEEFKRAREKIIF